MHTAGRRRVSGVVWTIAHHSRQQRPAIHAATRSCSPPPSHRLILTRPLSSLPVPGELHYCTLAPFAHFYVRLEVLFDVSCRRKNGWVAVVVAVADDEACFFFLSVCEKKSGQRSEALGGADEKISLTVLCRTRSIGKFGG